MKNKIDKLNIIDYNNIYNIVNKNIKNIKSKLIDNVEFILYPAVYIEVYILSFMYQELFTKMKINDEIDYAISFQQYTYNKINNNDDKVFNIDLEYLDDFIQAYYKVIKNNVKDRKFYNELLVNAITNAIIRLNIKENTKQYLHPFIDDVLLLKQGATKYLYGLKNKNNPHMIHIDKFCNIIKIDTKNNQFKRA